MIIVGAVASRYAEALFASAKAANEVDSVLQHLDVLAGLVAKNKHLREFFLNPDVDPEDKVGMLDRVTQSTWSELVRSFLLMLASLGRAELLDELVLAFHHLVDADRRRMRVTVRSARALPKPLVERLKRVIEKREAKTIEVEAEIDPSLLGGVQIVLGNRVIDSTIRRQLVELKRTMKEAAVK